MHRGVTIQEIIPYEILPEKSYEISLAAKFAGGKGKEKLKNSAIALSFKIRGTKSRLVISITWEKKLNTFNLFTPKEFNSYLVSVIDEPTTDELLESSLDQLMNKVVEEASSKSPTEGIQSTNLQSYIYWKFPIPSRKRFQKLMDIKVLTYMGNAKKNGMIVKVN